MAADGKTESTGQMPKGIYVLFWGFESDYIAEYLWDTVYIYKM